MPIYFLLYSLIFVFQGLLLFCLIQFPLSLWKVNPLYSTAVVLLSIIILLFYYAKIYDLFFLVKIYSEDEEKENPLYTDTLNIIKEKIDNNINKCRLIHLKDPHPVFLSYGDLMGNKRLVISSGALELLTSQELQALTEREIILLKGLESKLISLTSFLPFFLYSISSWFIESAIETRLRKPAGTSYLAGAIIFYAGRVSEFFLLPLSRQRHLRADKEYQQQNENSCALLNAIEKLSQAFGKPVKKGPPFRKRIYQAMKMFFPFDPVFSANTSLWQAFLDLEETRLMHLQSALENKNPYTRTAEIFSSHPPATLRFLKCFNSQTIENFIEKLPFQEKDLSSRIRLSFVPVILTFIGAALSIIFRGIFGLPLVLLGAGLTISFLYPILMSKRKSSSQKSDHIKIQGILWERTIPDKVDAPYYFIKSGNNILPLILKQLFRNEEYLNQYRTQQITAEGELKGEEIPYLLIKRITIKNPHKVITSYNTFYKLAVSTGITLLGVLMLLIEYFSV